MQSWLGRLELQVSQECLLEHVLQAERQGAQFVLTLSSKKPAGQRQLGRVRVPRQSWNVVRAEHFRLAKGQSCIFVIMKNKKK